MPVRAKSGDKLRIALWRGRSSPLGTITYGQSTLASANRNVSINLRTKPSALTVGGREILPREFLFHPCVELISRGLHDRMKELKRIVVSFHLVPSRLT